MSTMKTLGDFIGGGLWYWPADDDKVSLDSLQTEHALCFVPNSWMRFDGRRAHETMPFEGSRVSLVSFTVLGHENASQATRDFLVGSMVCFPSE